MIEKEANSELKPPFHNLVFRDSNSGDTVAQFFEQGAVETPPIGGTISLGEAQYMEDEGLDWDSRNSYIVDDLTHKYDLIKETKETGGSDRLAVTIIVEVTQTDS